MKIAKSSKSILNTVCVLAAFGMLSQSAVQAGTSAKAPVTVTPPPADPFVTGNLTVTYDTHFVSWGQDIWGAGNSFKDALIHPSMELDFNLGGGFQAYFNTWWDINDNASSSIGKYIQEIDVNVGIYYTVDKLKFQLGYGSWNYASQTEHVVEGKVTYTSLLNPFIALHGRVADGIPLDTGLVTVIGITPGYKVGPVDLAFPIAVSADTSGFHGGGAGFGFVSVGISASVPLSKHVVLGAGLTYYHTNSHVIVNPTEDFLTGSASIGITF